MEPIRKGVEFSGSGFAFDDRYGETKELTNIGSRLIRATQAVGFEHAWVPFVQGDTDTITGEQIADAKQDDTVLYLYPSTLNLKDYDAMMVFHDGGCNDFAGIIDGNVVITDISKDFTKDNLQFLIDNQGNAVPKSKVEEKQRDFARVQVQKYVYQRKKMKRQELDRDGKQTVEELKSVSDRLIYLSRRKEEIELMKIAYDMKAEDIAAAEREIKELFESEKLVNVEFPENGIVFTTKMLGIMDDAGKYHPIGEFRVQVNTQNSELTFTNTNNQLPKNHGKIAHPHVGDAGHPCLGNISSVVPELIAQYDILGLWQVILSFLTSYNGVDAWGIRLQYWPYLDKDGKPVSGKSLQDKGDNVYCNYCKVWHKASEVTMHTCPICGDAFCEENTPKYEHNGELYCSAGCLSAQKLSEGV